MQSHYEINVALNNRHLFATAPRSALSKETAEMLIKEMRSRFPESEGFKVTCTHWQGVGTSYDI
jgi:hypothetical protein